MLVVQALHQFATAFGDLGGGGHRRSLKRLKHMDCRWVPNAMILLFVLERMNLHHGNQCEDDQNGARLAENNNTRTNFSVVPPTGQNRLNEI